MSGGGLRASERMRLLAERVRSAVESAPWLFPGVAVALFLAVGLVGASRKEMWIDEIHTFALTRLGSLERIQAALDGGADGNRIGFYVLTLASARLLGLDPLSIRVPAVVGFLAFAACLGLFAARRCGARAGWVAASIPYLTGARFYAFEGRQYGPILGFTGVAILGWQASCEGRRGGRALFALALLGGCFVSPLMAFTVLALAAGEAWRSVASRRIDWFTCLTFGLAGGALLLSQRTAGAGFSRIAPCGGVMNALSPLPAILGAYGWLLGVAPFFYKTAIALAAWAAWQVAASFRDRRLGPASPRKSPVAGFLPHETAVAVFFLLTPVVVYVATWLPRWPCFPRYSIAASGGLALLIAALFCRLRAGGKSGASVVCVVALALSVVAATVVFSRPGLSGPAGLDVLAPIVESGEEPVVVASPFDHVKYTYYARPELQARLLTLYEPDPGQPGYAPDGPLVCLSGLQPYWPLRLETYRALVRTGAPFFLVTSSGEWEWIRTRLAADGFRLVPLGRAAEREVFSVEPPGRGPGEGRGEKNVSSLGPRPPGGGFPARTPPCS